MLPARHTPPVHLKVEAATAAGSRTPPATATTPTDGDRTTATDSITSTTTTDGYDQFDELTSYTQGSTSANYGYIGDGLRQRKTVGGTTTQETWDTAEGLPLLIQDGTTNEIDGPDGLPLEQITGSGTVSYYVHDQLGSTMALLGPGGRIATTYDYDAYGTLRASSIYPGIDTNLRYAGQYTDPETGLQYLQARYYDPASTQFLTVDPETAATQQPYAYANDSPTAAADPTGLCSAQAKQRPAFPEDTQWFWNNDKCQAYIPGIHANKPPQSGAHYNLYVQALGGGKHSLYRDYHVRFNGVSEHNGLYVFSWTVTDASGTDSTGDARARTYTWGVRNRDDWAEASYWASQAMAYDVDSDIAARCGKDNDIAQALLADAKDPMTINLPGAFESLIETRLGNAQPGASTYGP